MNKIAIIIPWYGKIPDYFPFFLKGLEYNTNVLDVLFFTDIEIATQTPTNFKKIFLPWKDLVQRIKSLISNDAVIDTAYKLCDYKPMYGKLFANELTEYQFWGYGDIDLIYGDLKVFLPVNGIDKYDVITFRENLIHGPFSVFRNIEYINNLYKKTNDLDRIVKNTTYVGFDEAARLKPWRSRKRIYNCVNLDNFWDWTCIVHHEADNGKLRLFERYYALEFILYNSILRYDDGKLFIGMEDYAFFHLVCHKNDQRFKIPKWKEIPDTFYVSKSGFYSVREMKYHAFLGAYRNILGVLKHLRKRFKDSLKYRYNINI